MPISSSTLAAADRKLRNDWRELGYASPPNRV